MNRKIQPHIRKIKDLNICTPIRTTLPNGIPLSIINAGEEDVVRIDIIFSGGRWHQSQKLQALFTNRMLREGTKKYSSAEIAKKLDYYGSWLELSTSSEYAFVTIYSLNKYVKEIINNPNMLRKMHEEMQKNHNDEAIKKLYDLCMELLDEK